MIAVSAASWFCAAAICAFSDAISDLRLVELTLLLADVLGDLISRRRLVR